MTGVKDFGDIEYMLDEKMTSYANDLLGAMKIGKTTRVYRPEDISVGKSKPKGIMIPERNEVENSYTIFVRAGLPESKAKRTAAHECGHIFQYEKLPRIKDVLNITCAPVKHISRKFGNITAHVLPSGLLTSAMILGHFNRPNEGLVIAAGAAAYYLGYAADELMAEYVGRHFQRRLE